tara:strand:+ start:2064 stop:2516 length:453 start_codon:yes stop_codon:yes gene_type:complete
MIKAIFLDWGKTVYDNDTQQDGKLYEGALETVEYLSKKYIVAMMSKTAEPLEVRKQRIESSPIFKYLKLLLIDPDDKNKLYEQALKHFNLKPEEVAIIDDRTKRGIQWGTKRGATTIWIRQGRYKDELPNEETGKPDYIIYDIKEAMKIL